MCYLSSLTAAQQCTMIYVNKNTYSQHAIDTTIVIMTTQKMIVRNQLQFFYPGEVGARRVQSRY